MVIKKIKTMRIFIIWANWVFNCIEIKLKFEKKNLFKTSALIFSSVDFIGHD
jgi:hypothetical protein